MRYPRATRRVASSALAAIIIGAVACAQPAGLERSRAAAVTVRFDFDHLPLPDIPLPNDIATRPDSSSRTGMRVNASMIASTRFEERTRTLLDTLDGWGVYQPISIPFSATIDVNSVVSRHRDTDYDTRDDAVYLIDIDRDSPDFGRIHHLDIGNGNYPVVLERIDRYGDNDPRGYTLSLPFEETDEDVNHNGRLDPSEDANRNGVLDPGEDLNANGVLDLPEDSDADGILDRPNYLPHRSPARDDLAGRADALMSFYERETNTLIVSPVTPLHEETTYAVVVTRRILDLKGNPVGSPFPYINHAAQTETLEPLLEVLPDGLEAGDIAFTFAYTTESVTADWVAAREGLYELGPQAHLGTEFPAEVERLFPLKETGPDDKFAGRSPYIMHHEDWESVLTLILSAFTGGSVPASSQQFTVIAEAHKYIDFHAMGTYRSPQLFDRVDDQGDPLALDRQSWPADLHRDPASARAEEVPFWVVVPRKEVSVRSEGKMVPLVLLGHGYGSNRATELMGFSGFFAEFGVAVISTDNVSHGLPITPEQSEQFTPLLETSGLSPAFDAITFTRGGYVDDDGDGVPDRHAQDLDRDGTIDSGADFWSAYLFHMRDMVRQSALDYMQLIRIIRTWDGTRRWAIDVNGDGLDNDLAGDFDGDGVVDIGSQSPIHVLGGSLGGIMATTLGALEPEVDTIIPIAGGGRLTEVGNRSLQGGVPQAVLLRVLGPLYLATVNDDGSATIHSQVTELNSMADIPIRQIPAGSEPQLRPGDTMVAENLANGELGCGYLLPDDDPDDGIVARARVGVASDVGDRTILRIYRGAVLQTGSSACELIDDPPDPVLVIDQMTPPVDPDGQPVTFEGLPIPGGELRAFAEGLGLRRASPDLRRFMGLAQMVIDPADPAVLARHLAAEPFEYPNKGDRTGAKFMIVTTVGDMNVPASTGVTVGRAAGVVDYLHDDPRYGKPVNQVLIDTYTTEAVNRLQRHRYVEPPTSDAIASVLHLDSSLGVHVDVDNFSRGQDIWGENIPRLDDPLRLMMPTDMWGNDLGGVSGAIFPYAIPQGQHGFPLPGEMTDWAIALCKERNGSSADECRTENIVGNTADIGWIMFHTFAAYFRSGGTEPPFAERCWAKSACNDVPPTPPARSRDVLP